MTARTKPMTKREAMAEVARLKREYPDTVNPHDSEWGGCLYHQGRGKNIKRCIVGQLAYDNGFPTPDAYAEGVDSLVTEGLWEGLLTESAADYLQRVQVMADAYDSDGVPTPWGQVKGIR